MSYLALSYLSCVLVFAACGPCATVPVPLLDGGWDYHDNFHIKPSQEFFDWLKGQGFTAPVASWEALTPDTAPFTRKALCRA